MAAKKKPVPLYKQVANLKHAEATRKNLPTAEHQSVMAEDERSPVRVAYERRNRDLDPQLVWRGKDEQDWSDLVVHAPPLYIQEKVHPKVLIDDLTKQTRERAQLGGFETLDLFADFNGLPADAKSTEFYQHDAHWTNRMILGDSLQVMASLAEREGLRGKVQCIYFDPPYGIRFNSNFQWSTTSRDVKDGKADHITREPEQVKAFRDTWRDGIHSYLTYLRDRLTVARDLLTDSGSIFVQIGDENVHRVRAVMDEVFGELNFVSLITVKKTSSASSELLAGVGDYLLWYGKQHSATKYRQPFFKKKAGDAGATQYNFVQNEDGTRRSLKKSESAVEAATIGKLFAHGDLTSQRPPGDFPIEFEGRTIRPSRGYWKSGPQGVHRLKLARRLMLVGNTLRYVRFFEDFPVFAATNLWDDTVTSGFDDSKLYVVQTNSSIVERCILMTTDPGDLVLDPTCGSGTTATVAEQWGRRWITIDTSRVALALARARIMGARYPFYLLADSREGQLKEAEVTRTAPSTQPVHGNIRHGFVYERVAHITLKSIANNSEIDVIWEKWQETLEPLRDELNSALKKNLPEWEIPRQAEKGWSDSARVAHDQWWEARINRQREIDASIAAKAESQYLYDHPYEDKKTVRVAGPFTVESLSPHRVLHVDENDEVVDGWRIREDEPQLARTNDFASMILDNLRTAGVQQAHKEDRIVFSSITPIPLRLPDGAENCGYICAEGRYSEGDSENAPVKRAGIFIGPEFGTVSRPDLVAAAREAGELGFDVLIACAFNYDAHSAEFEKLGRIPVLKSRMNADLHMAGDLKNTGKGNLFVIFGEPDIDILPTKDGKVQVKINGVDVFKPSSGEVVSSGPDGIACWFIDTDYNEESFFVRHAYFLGQNDPYKSLKTTLKAEIDEDAWSSLKSDTSRSFPKPTTGRIAVKVINHLGDEVMKVFSVT
ncbi:site-specific DNA-methyltransferase [Luteolibacter soli]|uniref:site-specific DNA-methyltransferase (adenine-specific) n=1 Tax=Luteolibacter soli TaxID=3135280 RepID=A0ABU9ASD1_9BACT